MMGPNWEARWVRTKCPPRVVHRGVDAVIEVGIDFPQLLGDDGTKTDIPQLLGADVMIGIKTNRPPRVAHRGVVSRPPRVSRGGVEVPIRTKTMTKTDVIKLVHPWENGVVRLPVIALAMVDLDLGEPSTFFLPVFRRLLLLKKVVLNILINYFVFGFGFSLLFW